MLFDKAVVAFTHKHYVPILKAKEGEYRAMKALSVKAQQALTPLIEVPGVPWDFAKDMPSCGVDEHVEDVAGKIHGARRKTGRVFIDLRLMAQDGLMADGSQPLAKVFADARAMDLEAVPVTGLDRDAAYQNAVRDIAAADQKGVCIRLNTEDLEDLAALAKHLSTLLKHLRVSAAAADLLLDFGAILPDSAAMIRMAAKIMLPKLPMLRDWRTLTIAGTGFPQNLTEFDSDSVTSIPRTEWALWLDLACKGKLPRIPSFGDYTIAHPEITEIDPRIVNPSVSLRYTTDRGWLIFKGRGVRKHGSQQSHALCQDLVNRPEYSGKTFSWGDTHIHECACNKGGPGNATTWRQVGTNHHVEFVVRQIASPSVP